MESTLKSPAYAHYRHHILTADTLTIVTSSDPIQITSADPKFDDACELARSGRYADLVGLFNRETALANYSRGEFTFLSDGGIVLTATDEVLPPVLGARMVAFMDAQVDYAPLLRFWERLARNPDPHIREQIYPFLDQNHGVFLEDGQLLMYKKVAGDYSASRNDKAGNKVYWRVGTVVGMKREDCVADPEETCSAGLHAGVWDTASIFQGSRMLELVIDPEHIVSVPYDYNAMKIRCCRAYVRAENVSGKWQGVTTSTVPATTVMTKFHLGMVEDLRKGKRLRLTVSPSGYLNIPAPVMRATGYAPGDIAAVVLPSKRHRSLLVGNLETPDGAYPFQTETKVLVCGNVRIRAASLAEAGIDGAEHYSLALLPGNILDLRRG